MLLLLNLISALSVIFCLCGAANGFPETELGTQQERQVQGANNNVLVPDYMYGCRRSGKTLLQMEED